jgi:hypothetical protein
MAVTKPVWTPSSWRSFPVLHQPEWPAEERADTDAGVLVRARLPRRELTRFAPYLVAGERYEAGERPGRESGRL